MRLSLCQRTFLIENLILSHQNITHCKSALKSKFKVKKAPDAKAIRALYKKFKEHGTVHDLDWSRPRSVVTEEKITQVQGIIETTPTKSIRKISSERDMSFGTVQKILKKDLSFKPYKALMVQGLKSSDHPQRQEFCRWFNSKVERSEGFINNVIFSDEASFHLSGSVNRQNTRYWGIENPHTILESKRFSPHLNVWIAVSSTNIFGPYFFEEDNKTVTVNSNRYVSMLNDNFIPELRNRGYRLCRTYFQQDNATPHESGETKTFLKKKFPERNLITKPLWPPRSPDLTPLDFFVFGYLKSKVYTNNPQTLNELKENIKQEVRNMPRTFLQNSFISLQRRINLCLRTKGGHLQHLL